VTVIIGAPSSESSRRALDQEDVALGGDGRGAE
jgi:hypothetical protein